MSQTVRDDTAAAEGWREGVDPAVKGNGILKPVVASEAAAHVGNRKRQDTTVERRWVKGE
jgi:hypothetical protein